jgi:polyhydroxybutyrate depolymerase
VVVVVALAIAGTACSRRDRDAGPAPGAPGTLTDPPASSGSSGTTGSPGAPAGTGSTSNATSTTVPVRAAVDPVGQKVDGTITPPGQGERTYHLYVPASLPKDRPVPLLVALHGGTGWGTQFEQQSGFDGLAEANQFLVVYPDGVNQPGTTANGRVWNGGACCGIASRQDVDDVGFVSALIDQLEGQFDIDRTRVDAAGHSNGAIMAYRLGCELADKIVAIGLQAGAVEIPSCQPSQPVSVIHIHGTADQNVPIDGGKGAKGISNVAFNPPIDGIRTFAAADGCPTDPRTTARGDVTTDAWAPCRASAEVEFVRVTGANHAWMGHPASKVAEVVVGTPYMGFDSSAEIWAFLAAHPRG